MKLDLQENVLIFYGLLSVSLILIRIPYVGVFLRTVNTLIHETGHALAAILVSGRVIRINIFNDTSGTTLTQAKSKASNFFVAIAGYPFSSLAALSMFFMIFHGFDELALYILLGIAISALILFVRNRQGIVWLIFFILITGSILLVNHKAIILFTAIAYSTILLADSVSSVFQLLIINIKKPKQAGDSSNLQKLTKIPSIIWSIIFLLISGLLFYITIKLYFPEIPFLKHIQ